LKTPFTLVIMFSLLRASNVFTFPFAALIRCAHYSLLGWKNFALLLLMLNTCSSLVSPFKRDGMIIVVRVSLFLNTFSDFSQLNILPGCQGYDNCWIYDHSEINRVGTPLRSDKSGIRCVFLYSCALSYCVKS
jgi:hypothetical protein